MPSPLGGHFLQDRAINVASRVLTKKNDRPPSVHVFRPAGNIFELIQDIIRINVLRMSTMFYYSHIIKNAPPCGGHVFQPTGTIFELVLDISGTNLLNKCNEDRTINVASRVLTRQILTPHDGQKSITKADHEHIVLK
ncbi:hypothetical protein DPMN_009455 [Dreissena polymorpha]|uniref:Uncharacterized protein n=1 Tax=Dreissena polymorpha TaxID=45954 RepID=A0A9D4N0I0_DREPO|nr:hypothetical protein DPMN_009455 [Dreissena polymorpha]